MPNGSAAPASVWWRNRLPVPYYYKDDPFITGPTQADDLGLLFGVIRETRPKTLIEIGFFNGDGTRALLSAADPDSQVFSFDYTLHFRRAPMEIKSAMAAVRARGERVPGWKLVLKNATRLTAADVEDRPVDFVFFDGPHLLSINRLIFQRIVPLLSPFAIVAVHDTGYWSLDWLQRTRAGRHYIREWCHRPALGHVCDQRTGSATQREMLLHPNSREERLFIEWVLRNGSGTPFSAVSLHTFNYLRNGVTLLQRKHRRDNDWRR